MDEREKKNGFKVMDRRRFDLEGNSRPGSEGGSAMGAEGASESAAPKPQPSPARPAEPRTEQKSSSHEEHDSTGDSLGESDESPRDFLAFISSLGTQAAAALSGVDVRSGMSVPPDPVMAKHYIDILEMLREKTKGNLTTEESGMFDQVLHQLRLAFVRVSTGGKPG